jgi:hypothetical protein
MKYKLLRYYHEDGKYFRSFFFEDENGNQFNYLIYPELKITELINIETQASQEIYKIVPFYKDNIEETIIKFNILLLLK